MNQRERNALDRHITGNYGEDQFPEDAGEMTDEQVEEERKAALEQLGTLEEFEIPKFSSIEEATHFLKQVTDKVQEMQNPPLDPLVSMDNRATVAENMLDNYHLLKTNLKTRQAIYHTLCSQQASELRRGAAWQLVEQAQAELDQQKYEILELMGVDS